MGYQSKTWSLSDDVVEEIGRRVTAMIETTGAGSPNRVLKELLFPPQGQLVVPAQRRALDDALDGNPQHESPARELSAELEEE